MSNIIEEATIVRQYAPIEGTKETEGRGHAAERTGNTTKDSEDVDHKPFKEKVKGLFHRDKGDKLEETHLTTSDDPSKAVVVCNDSKCTAPKSTTLQVACNDPRCTGPRAVPPAQAETHVMKNQSEASERETDRKPLKEQVKELFHRDKEEAEGHKEKERTEQKKADDKEHSKQEEIAERPTMKDKIAATVHNVKDKVHPYIKDGEKGASSHHHTAADEAAVRHHLAEHPGAGAKIGAKFKQEAAEATKEHIKHKIRVKLGKEKDTTDKQKQPAEKQKKAKDKEHRRTASNEAAAQPRKEKGTAIHRADSETTMVCKEGHLPAAQVRAVQQADPAIQSAIHSIQQSTGHTPAVNIIVVAEPAKSSAMSAVKEAGVKAKDLTVEGAHKVMDAALVAKDKIETKIAEHKANNADKGAEGGGLAGMKEKALDGAHKVAEAAAPVVNKIKDSALVAKDKMSELIAAHKADELEPEASKVPPDTVLVSETITKTVYEAGDAAPVSETEGRGAHNPCTVVMDKALEIVHHAKDAVAAGVGMLPGVGPKLVKHEGDIAIEDGQQHVLVRDAPLDYTMRGEVPEVKPTDNKDELFNDNPSLSMKDKVQHAKDAIVGGMTKAAAAIPVVGPKLVQEHAEPDAAVAQGREPDIVAKPSEIVREEVPLIEQQVLVEHKNPPELVPSTDLDAQRATPILPNQGFQEGSTILVAPLGPGGFKDAVTQTNDEVRIRTAEDEIILRKHVVMGKQPVDYTLRKEVADLNRLDNLDRPTFKEKLHDTRKDEQRY